MLEMDVKQVDYKKPVWTWSRPELTVNHFFLWSGPNEPNCRCESALTWLNFSNLNHRGRKHFFFLAMPAVWLRGCNDCLSVHLSTTMRWIAMKFCRHSWSRGVESYWCQWSSDFSFCAIMRLTFLFLIEISGQLLDGLMLNLVQTFIVPGGWSL